MADNRRFLGGSNEHFQSMNVKNQLLVTNELVELVKFVQNNSLNKRERCISFKECLKSTIIMQVMFIGIQQSSIKSLRQCLHTTSISLMI